ncbi:MAG: hypothetical protein J6Z04_07185 [Clostridia bacterium]|nr:hypothetical protein [Clostridia bacterium]
MNITEKATTLAGLTAVPGTYAAVLLDAKSIKKTLIRRKTESENNRLFL